MKGMIIIEIHGGATLAELKEDQIVDKDKIVDLIKEIVPNLGTEVVIERIQSCAVNVRGVSQKFLRICSSIPDPRPVLAICEALKPLGLSIQTYAVV